MKGMSAAPSSICRTVVSGTLLWRSLNITTKLTALVKKVLVMAVVPKIYNTASARANRGLGQTQMAVLAARVVPPVSGCRGPPCPQSHNKI